MSADALNAALAYPLYSGGRRALLLVLAWRANDAYGHCIWMSKTALGKQAGLNPRLVQRYLREFESDGIIALAGAEDGRPNTYHFNTSALERGGARTPPTGGARTPPVGRTDPPTGGARTPLKKERHEKKLERKGAAPRTPNGAAPRPAFNKVTMRLPSVEDVRPAETTFTKALAELDRTGRFASKTEAARHLMDLSSEEIENLAKRTEP